MFKKRVLTSSFVEKNLSSDMMEVSESLNM